MSIIQEWVQALRSGEYNQGQAYLRNTDDEYCCLGVLCDLLPGVEWESPDVESELQRPFYNAVADGDYRGSTLPTPVFNLLASEYPLDDFLSLNVNRWMGWNDTGRSFEDIADDIERTFA